MASQLVCPFKTAARIEVLFGVETLGGLRNIVVSGVPNTLQGGEKSGEKLPSIQGKERKFDAALAKLLWPLVLTE